MEGCINVDKGSSVVLCIWRAPAWCKKKMQHEAGGGIKGLMGQAWWLGWRHV